MVNWYTPFLYFLVLFVQGTVSNNSSAVNNSFAVNASSPNAHPQPYESAGGMRRDMSGELVDSVDGHSDSTLGALNFTRLMHDRQRGGQVNMVSDLENTTVNTGNNSYSSETLISVTSNAPTNGPLEHPTNLSLVDLVFPTFSDNGYARLYRPQIRPLSDLIAGKMKDSLSQPLEGEPRRTQPDPYFVVLDHARLAQTRYGEVKGQLNILKDLSQVRGSGGRFRGISYRRVSSAEHLTPESNGNWSGHPIGQLEELIVNPDCRPTKTQPWLKQRPSFTLFFRQDQIRNISLSRLFSAHVTIQFKGTEDSVRPKDNLLLLLAQNKRSYGGRKTSILTYRYLDSTRSANVSINILNQLKRWLRNPAKNRGLSLTLQNSFGDHQNVRDYIQVSENCTDTSSGVAASNDTTRPSRHHPSTSRLYTLLASSTDSTGITQHDNSTTNSVSPITTTFGVPSSDNYNGPTTLRTLNTTELTTADSNISENITPQDNIVTDEHTSSANVAQDDFITIEDTGGITSEHTTPDLDLVTSGSENTTSVTVVTPEHTNPVDFITPEHTTPVNIITPEYTTPVDIITSEHTTPVDIITSEHTTPVDFITSEHMTPVVQHHQANQHPTVYLVVKLLHAEPDV